MPLVNALPTWLAVNNANFTTESGMQDPVTGQPETGGALNAGDYTDYTNPQAATASYTANGILYEGRYRYVQVDSSATAANVKTGTIGYLRSGGSGNVKTAVITGAGSGQTNGTFQIAGVGGGGSGAVLQVVIAGGLVTNVSVVNGGYGYYAVPTFTISEGGTPGTVVAQLDTTPNIVTSYDIANALATLVRPVVFLNSITPGNYGFVQELGTATVLGKATSFTGAAATGVVVQPTTGGVVDVPSSTTAITTSSLGIAVDTPEPGALFKVYLQYVPFVQG